MDMFAFELYFGMDAFRVQIVLSLFDNALS